MRRRACMDAWRRSWVLAGLRAWASPGRGLWRWREGLQWGRVWGPLREAFPAACVVVSCMRMWWWWRRRWLWWWRLWSRRRERRIWGGRRGVPGGGGGRRMLGPVSNEDEGAGSGIGCVRALSLVSRLRAGAGAVGGVMCGTSSRSGVVSAVRVSGLSRGGSTSAPGRVRVFAGGSRGC